VPVLNGVNSLPSTRGFANVILLLVPTVGLGAVPARLFFARPLHCVTRTNLVAGSLTGSLEQSADVPRHLLE
jgi:hypothetical protein